MSSEISKKTLDQFVKLGGYEIAKFDREKNRWKGVSEASRVTKLHRDTITRILKEHPTKPVKEVMPEYYEDFKDSKGYKMIEKEIGHKPWFKDVERVALTVFHFLGNKDPIYWTLEDMQKLRRNCLQLRNPVTEDIDPNQATDLRRALKALYKDELKRALEMVPKPPAGKKLEWYLEEEDLIKLIHQIERPDLLLYLYTGVTTGARHSGIVSLVPERIKSARGEMLIYEPKRKEYVPKIIPQCVLDLLDQYVIDFGFKGDERIFPLSYSVYNDLLTRTGKKAGLTETTSTHILKHSFVSQAGFHGVSLDIISKQTGTEESTLKKFYRAEDVRRARHELRGDEYGVIPFPEWVEKVLHPHFADRYKEIKDKYVRKDGLRLKPLIAKPEKPEKPKVKRVFSWQLCKKRAESKPKHPVGTVEYTKAVRIIGYWKAIWHIHQEFPDKPYAEIKEILLKRQS